MSLLFMVPLFQGLAQIPHPPNLERAVQDYQYYPGYLAYRLAGDP